MAETDANSGGASRTPAEEAQRLFEQAEGHTAEAMERLVRGDSFGELLAQVTENAMALNRIATAWFDLVVRNLRIAGRQDITNLGRQLARTEDKLERVLQEVERLQEEVRATTSAESEGGDSAGGATTGPGESASGGPRSPTGNPSGAGKRGASGRGSPPDRPFGQTS